MSFQVPAKNFSEGLNVAVNHLLLRGTLTTRLVHHDEPMLIVTAREKWRHLSGWTITEVGVRVKRRVTGVTRPINTATNRSKPGGARCGSNGMGKQRKRSTSESERWRTRKTCKRFGGGEEAFMSKREAGGGGGGGSHNSKKG